MLLAAAPLHRFDIVEGLNEPAERPLVVPGRRRECQHATVFVRLDVANSPCLLADADTVANLRLKNLHRH